MKMPRRRTVLITLATLALALLVGHQYLSRRIAAKLKSTMQEKLAAQLDFDHAWYVPPYGMHLRGVRVRQGGSEVLTVARLNVSLERLPAANQPVIIHSLDVRDPVVRIPRGGIGTSGATTQPRPQPQKLSTLFHLRRLRIIGGQVSDERGDVPLVWRNIDVDVDLTAQSDAKYNFALAAGDGSVMQVQSQGAIDIDEFLLDVNALRLEARTQAQVAAESLPPAVQRVLRETGIGGTVTVQLRGHVPLREPARANYSATVELKDVRAAPFASIALQRGDAKLTVQQDARPPAATTQPSPLRVTLESLNLRGASERLTAQSAELTVDFAAKEWSLRNLRGAVEFAAPSRDENRSAGRPALGGRVDFTAAASAPLDRGGKPWADAINHDAMLQPRDVSFQPKGFPQRIERINGEGAHVANGVIEFKNLTGVYGADRIDLRSARFALRELPAAISFREIDSTVTFAAPLGKYPEKLAKVINALGPAGPFVIGGDYSILRNAAGRRERSRYELLISSDVGALNVAGSRLPFSKVRGDAHVTPGRVQLGETTANIWDGSIAASGIYTFGESLSYHGHVIARDIDLQKLAPADLKLRGRGFVEARFEGDRGDNEWLNHLTASGEAEVMQGEFFEIRVLRELLGKTNVAREAVTVGDGASLFEMKDGIIDLRRAAVSAPVLGLQGGGKVGLDGTIELEVVAAPLADWRDKMKQAKIPIVSDVAGEIVGAVQRVLNLATGALLYQFRIDGSLREPHVTAIPVPALSDAGALLFGRMLDEKRGQRLLDFLKAE